MFHSSKGSLLTVYRASVERWSDVKSHQEAHLVIGEDPEGVELDFWGKAWTAGVGAPNHACHKRAMT